jgi:transcriptional regulator with XRE-family HTH domain
MSAHPNRGKPRPLATFGGRLRAERERLGLNQRDFAALAGNSKETQVNYEAERRSPDARAMMAWAAQGVDVLFVLTGRRAPDPVAPMDHDALWAGIEAEAARLRDALAAFHALLAGVLGARPKDRDAAALRRAIHRAFAVSSDGAASPGETQK